MPSLGPLELIMIATIALIVFGPQKLPEIARTIGRFLTQMRRMAAEVRSEFAEGLDDPADEDDVTDEDDEAIDEAAGRAEPPADEDS